MKFIYVLFVIWTLLFDVLNARPTGDEKSVVKAKPIDDPKPTGEKKTVVESEPVGEAKSVHEAKAAAPPPKELTKFPQHVGSKDFRNG